MNIRFQLRSQGKKNPIINMFIFDSRFSGRKFKYSTGISVEAGLWDKRKNRLKLGKISNLNPETRIAIDKHLDSLEQAAALFLGKFYGANFISSDELRSHLKTVGSKGQEKPDKSRNNLFEVWYQIIGTTKSPTGESITSGTKRSKIQTLMLVKQYCEELNKSLTLASMDMAFYHDFDSFMLNRGLNGNTRGKHFKEIKAILREAQDRDMEVNLAFQKKSFKVIRGSTDSIYLTETEIKKIFQLKFVPNLEVKRDLFVMACYTGLRHSDWHQIRQANIIRDADVELLKVTQQKTKDSIHIPVHSAVKCILNKYNGCPPKVVANQKFNAALKEIAQQADLGQVTINGKQMNKWELISTHTARRSFATNAYLSQSMDVYQIMKCTGHKSESSFLKYLKLNGRDFAVQAAESKFFTDKSWTTLKVAS